MTQEQRFSVAQLAGDGTHAGRMNDPTGSARIRGLCGDVMEFYLDVREERIVEVRFHPEGCEVTAACGALAARLAEGRSVDQALHISPGDLIDRISDLAPTDRHCAILAVTTLYAAVADYLLKP